LYVISECPVCPPASRMGFLRKQKQSSNQRLEPSTKVLSFLRLRSPSPQSSESAARPSTGFNDVVDATEESEKPLDRWLTRRHDDPGISPRERLDKQRRKGSIPLSTRKPTGHGPFHEPPRIMDTADHTTQAVTQLNSAVIRLHKTCALLTDQLNPRDLSTVQLNLPSLDVDSLDTAISNVQSFTQQLLAERRRVRAEGIRRNPGLLAIEKFLKTTCYIVTPALKSFLAVAVQGSAVSSCSRSCLPYFVDTNS
jgi:hypothetical protein